MWLKATTTETKCKKKRKKNLELTRKCMCNVYLVSMVCFVYKENLSVKNKRQIARRTARRFITKNVDAIFVYEVMANKAYMSVDKLKAMNG